MMWRRQKSTTDFKLVPHEQGSPAWLAWRHNGIGATDASVIMGENRFKRVEELLKEKRGPVHDSYKSSAMILGAKLEPKARQLYIEMTGNDVRPVCIQSTHYDWLRASLDGISERHDKVVEIKCGESAYRRVSQTQAVPDYYYGQTQHILALTGLSSLDFWCYWPDCQPILLQVPRDGSYIKHLLKRELQFWKSI